MVHSELRSAPFPDRKPLVEGLVRFLRRHHINAGSQECRPGHREYGSSTGGRNNPPPWWIYLIGGVIVLWITCVIAEWMVRFILPLLPWVIVGIVGVVVMKMFLSR